MANTVGVKNPYRYRGYRYDTETGLYYLQSRYYNPEWGRFINADGIAGSIGELLGHNIFAYCKNNPVDLKDTNGFRPEYAANPTHETEDERDDSFSTMSRVYAGSVQQKRRNSSVLNKLEQEADTTDSKAKIRSLQADAGIMVIQRDDTSFLSRDYVKYFANPMMGISAGAIASYLFDIGHQHYYFLVMWMVPLQSILQVLLLVM